MRGQRLFIRELQADDRDAIRDFFARHGREGVEAPASGTIGKLVGDLVAVAGTSSDGDTVRVEQIFVAPELRRKRIGRFMLDEVVNIARKLERESVVVEDAGDAGEFLRKVGFVQHGNRWERRLR